MGQGAIRCLSGHPFLKHNPQKTKCSSKVEKEDDHCCVLKLLLCSSLDTACRELQSLKDEIEQDSHGLLSVVKAPRVKTGENTDK